MQESIRSRHAPRIKQLSCFLENRVGSLQRLISTLEKEGVHVCAISILDAADHAVVRLIVDRPGAAIAAMTSAGYSVFQTELIGVAIPREEHFGIRKVLACLLRAELNVKYVYSLIVLSAERPILAVNVEDLEEAGRVLERAGLHLVHQDEIGLGEP